MWTVLIKVYIFIELFERESSPVAEFIGFLLCHFLYLVTFYWLALAYHIHSPSKYIHILITWPPDYMIITFPVLVRSIGFVETVESDDD